MKIHSLFYRTLIFYETLLSRLFWFYWSCIGLRRIASAWYATSGCAALLSQCEGFLFWQFDEAISHIVTFFRTRRPWHPDNSYITMVTRVQVDFMLGLGSKICTFVCLLKALLYGRQLLSQFLRQFQLLRHLIHYSTTPLVLWQLRWNFLARLVFLLRCHW